MHIIHNVIIDCSAMYAEDCSDRCITGLGHNSDFKLMANASDDVVNGFVTISHNDAPEPHEIIIHLYDEEELPNEGHATTFRPANPMPTEEELIQRLVTSLEDN